MDHKSGGFIYDGQRLVFINDLDRNIFRRKGIGRRRDQFDFDLVVFAELVGRFRDLTVYEDVFVFDQALQARPAPTVNL